MNIKSLAIAAAIVTTAGAAQAADLGHPVKAAVDYVKVCDAYGAGFFYIPGSDTCLQLSGYVRETITAANGTGVYKSSGRGANSFASATQAEVHWDARSNTEFGLLRSFISVDFNFNSFGGTTVGLDKAYIQLGGLTVGRAASMYDFWYGTTDQLSYSEVFADQTVNLLAYTFAFGNGVSATVSLEDSTTSTRTGGATFTYGGNNAPDIVANLNVTQAWGSAQISAAAHQVYGSTAALGTKWGYGILAGAWVNLPTLGAGDKIGIQAAYGEGAQKFVSSETYVDGNIGVDSSVAGPKLTKSWAVGAGFYHTFSSTVGWGINGGVFSSNGFGATDYVQWSVGSTLYWTPVKNFSVSASAEYTDVNFSSATTAALPKYVDSTGWLVGLRLKRSF